MKNNYEILGLPENASANLIEKKYGALLRQYKQRVNEKGVTYDDLEYYKSITQAYDEITGKKHDYSDESPESIIPFAVRRRFEKISAYLSQYALLIIAFVIVATLGVMIYFQVKENKKHDISIKFVGAFSAKSNIKLNDEIKKKSLVIKEPTASFFTVTTETGVSPDKFNEAQAFLFQLVGKNLDVIFIDKESYDVYIEENAFMALDDILEEFKGQPLYAKLLTYRYKRDPNIEEHKQPPEGIYGIDITDSSFFNDLSLEWLHDTKKGQEKTMIFTIARTTKNKDKAVAFMNEILKTLP